MADESVKLLKKTIIKQFAVTNALHFLKMKAIALNYVVEQVYMDAQGI